MLVIRPLGWGRAHKEGRKPDDEVSGACGRRDYDQLVTGWDKALQMERPTTQRKYKYGSIINKYSFNHDKPNFGPASSPPDRGLDRHLRSAQKRD
jgi:hypothetical protein